MISENVKSQDQLLYDEASVDEFSPIKNRVVVNDENLQSNNITSI